MVRATGVQLKWLVRSGILALVTLLAMGPAEAQVLVAGDGLTFGTCSGSFHDTGGPGGDYANNEALTVTICPSGGAGSGPFTSVRFTQWSIAPGPGDTLRIYDGTTVGGTLLAEGTSATSLSGQTFTATSASGCLTFRWVSNAGGTAAGWTALVLTGPDAGQNASITVCSTEAPFSMRARLNGTPDAGGSWTGPGGAHPDLFNPATDTPGIYTYTVSGPAPCPDSSAVLTIAVVTAPNAGTNGALTVCNDAGPQNLFNSLGGTPQAGGSWTGPGGGAHSGVLDPTVGPAGTYTYTVPGTAPCGPASAVVSVTIEQRPNAGTNGTAVVCSNGAPFNLFSSLGGSPQPGGSWTGPGGGAVAATYTPGSSTPGVYTYTLSGTTACASSSATVTVTQVTAPNAGIDRALVVCSDDAPFNLLSQLNGTPNAGGTWVGPNGPHGATFNPATDPPGNYTYTVTGTAPCANATAVLNITVRIAPDAGSSAVITVCSTDASFPLFNRLGGSPDLGGTWTAPGGGAHPGTFIPGTSAAGVYTYTVVGQSPCDPATATVTVNVNIAPVAGTNASVVRCSNDAPFSLFAQLGGSPNPGGTWTGPGGAHSGTFTPGVDQPGAYTYTVLGTAPCANATAVVTVSIVTAPNAGTNGSTTVCSNGAPFSLFALLGGTPDATGTWSGPGGATSGTFTPGTSQAGVYTYTVAGTAPCANASATVTVSVVAAPNAGTNGSITVCSDQGPVNL
nr:hypothetical protein [Flavobacteriales bacterium]